MTRSDPTRPGNLLAATVYFFRWGRSVLAKFRSIDAIDTWLVIVSSIFRKLFAVVALFLPLKVILLVGSEGVPRYFRAFIHPETRDQWIIYLAIGAVVLYFASLLLGMLERNHAMRGSVKVMRSASEIARFRNQEGLVENYYSKFCGLQANLILALVLVAVAVAMFPALGIFLIFLIAVEWLLAALVLGRLQKIKWSGLAYLLRFKSQSVLGVVSAVNFLLVFGFLLIVFIWFGGVNILIAILAILIARQLFSSLAGVVSTAVDLASEEKKVNTLVFKEHSYHGTEERQRGPYTKLYAVETRRKRLADQLGAGTDEVESLVSESGPRDLLLFDIIRKKDTSTQHYTEIVFSSSKAHLAANEDVLFNHQESSDLKFADLLGQYEVDGFTGRIYDCNRSEPISPGEWNKFYTSVVKSSWKVKPSSRLLDAYTASHPLLQDKLTPLRLSRMEIALEKSHERKRYDQLLEILDPLRRVIGEMALFVFNPKISRAMTGVSPSGDLRFLNWTSWTLAPVGVGIGIGDAKRNIMEEAAASGELGKETSAENMLLAGYAWELEKHLHAQEVVSARELLPEMLAAWDAFTRRQ